MQHKIVLRRNTIHDSLNQLPSQLWLNSGIFFAPKGIPAPALKALREAFSKVWKDPQFAAD